jgi:hypothetical protein
MYFLLGLSVFSPGLWLCRLPQDVLGGDYAVLTAFQLKNSATRVPAALQSVLLQKSNAMLAYSSCIVSRHM